MKKIILAVILVAAAGGTTYYLLQKKTRTIVADFKQEEILGKWKLDSLAEGKDSAFFFVGLMGMIDSNLMNYHYDFRKEGMIVKLLGDSVQKDTAHFEWTKDNRLNWKEQGDSIGSSFIVSKLNKDSLVLVSNDSSFVFFSKVR